MALRDKIFSAAKTCLRREPVTIRLGKEKHDIFIRELTGRERAELERFIHSRRDDKGNLLSLVEVSIKLIQMSAVDEDGAAIFKAEDYEQIGSLPVKVIEELNTVAALLSGMIESDDEETIDDEQGTLDDEPEAVKVPYSKNERGGIGVIS